jgi:hypothetical protein
MSSKFDRVMKIFASAGTDVSNNLVMSRFEARNNGETVSADVVRKARKAFEAETDAAEQADPETETADEHADDKTADESTDEEVDGRFEDRPEEPADDPETETADEDAEDKRAEATAEELGRHAMDLVGREPFKYGLNGMGRDSNGAPRAQGISGIAEGRAGFARAHGAAEEAFEHVNDPGAKAQADFEDNHQDEPEQAEAKSRETPKVKTGYSSTHPKGTVSDSARRCGAPTKSGPCVRPLNHGFGHMSQAVLDVKSANAKAKRDAKTAAKKAAKHAEAEAAAAQEKTEDTPETDTEKAEANA